MTSTTATSTAPVAGRAQPVGTRAQVLGLSLVALGALLMFTIGTSTGVPLGEGMFFVVMAVASAGAAALAWRFGTWATAVALVITLGVAGSLFWTVFGLSAPASPGDFVTGVMVPLGIVLGLVGGVRALISRRRGNLSAVASRGEVRTRGIVIGLVIVAAVVSVSANLLTRASVAPAAAADATPVAMRGMAFEPATFTVAAGEDATLLVANSDGFLHDFTLPDHDLAVTVAPGSEALLDVSSLPPGSYTAYCTLHSDTSVSDPEAAGMAATLVVE